MTIKEAERKIDRYMDSFGAGLDACDNDLFSALYMSLNSMKALEEIKQIINAPIYLQEDVWRYKAICEVIKRVEE